MFTRQLIVAAAMMAATCAANAEAISTTSAVSSGSTLTSDLSIVDTSTALTGADSGLASVLASTSTNLVLMRGVEGTFMLAARAAVGTDAATTSGTTSGTTSDATTSPTDTAALIGSGDATSPTLTAADPVVTAAAAAVPEPATMALMLAGLLGAIGFTRARKQG